MKIQLLLFLIWFVACCRYPREVTTSLKLAGDNRQQLEKVIKHYKKNSENEKLRAACFLIANMKDKGTYVNELVDNDGNPVGFNISNFKNEAEEYAWLDSVKATRGNLYNHEEFLPDLEYITAEFLINNIDKAFEVKRNSPFCKGISDADFFEYILPYRVSYEKPEYWRDYVLIEFAELKDILYRFTTVLAATNFVDNWYQKQFKFGGARYFKEKKVRCYSELLRDKAGKCDDMCNLVVMGLRALGIPCGFDGISYKRASDSVGHGWCFVLDTKTKKKYPFDALSNNGPGLFNLPYKNAPKVFRKQFAVIEKKSVKNNYGLIHSAFYMDNSLDVTSEYFETSDITFHFNKPYPVPLYLCIWHQRKWKPIDYYYNPYSANVNFYQVSKNNLYCLISYQSLKNEIIKEPFIINKFEEIKYSSSLGVQRKVSLKSYKDKQLTNSSDNKAVIYEFGLKNSHQKASEKTMQKTSENEKEEWVFFPDSLESNRFYFLSDVSQSKGRIFVLKENGKTVEWY